MEYSDLPRVEVMRRAEAAAQQGWTVHFKFTCEGCGKRCTLQEPNVLYEYGECFKCGHKTKLDSAGFMLMKLGGVPQGG